MIKIGDTVKVIGKTICGNNEEVELIPIGTICLVVGTQPDNKKGNIVGVVPENNPMKNGFGEYWYLEKDVEKGHMVWVKD